MQVFCIADLPGWGYAKISKGGQRQIEDFLIDYLRVRCWPRPCRVLSEQRHARFARRAPLRALGGRGGWSSSSSCCSWTRASRSRWARARSRPGAPLAPSPAGGASDGARGAGNGQPQASDAEAMGLLEEMGMPFLVVATKTDKLSSRSPCPSRAPGGGGVSARRSSTRAGSPPRAGSVDPPPPISSAAPANAGGASVVECACAGV